MLSLKVARKKRHTQEKSSHRLRKLWLILPLAAMLAGVYLLLLVFAPAYNAPAPSTSSQNNWNKPVPRTELTEQRLYIPRLSLNLLYADEQRALREGLWHRFPERGDPEDGNFILAGHRFEIGLTPGETKRRSPLYHIDKIQAGDYIYADFNGKRYQYEVTRKYKVKPKQTEIEEPSSVAKMTLYTCTLKGEADGREVLEAKLIKDNVDPTDALALRKD